MWTKNMLIISAAVALGASVRAEIFKVEIPAELTREDVLNPTPEVAARLDGLLRAHISQYPAWANCGAVGFTKDGELIYGAVEWAGKDNWEDNRITFEPAGEFLNHPGSWEAAEWHLHEVGQPEYNGVYDLAQDIFGYPFYPGNLTVYVKWDPRIPVEEGYYNITTQTIYLKNWRNWEDYLNQSPENHDFHDDAAVLGVYF